jgi:hypothetical protein
MPLVKQIKGLNLQSKPFSTRLLLCLRIRSFHSEQQFCAERPSSLDQASEIRSRPYASPHNVCVDLVPLCRSTRAFQMAKPRYCRRGHGNRLRGVLWEEYCAFMIISIILLMIC